MRLFLFLPLLPAILAFLMTSSSAVETCAAFYDITFGAYAVFVALAFYTRWEERRCRERAKTVALYSHICTLCIVLRFSYIACAVMFLMINTLISTLNIDVPLIATLVATAYGITTMATGFRFLYEIANIDGALLKDLKF